jgi:pilus assembly protein CpaE
MEYGDCFRCSDLSFFSDKDRIGTAGHRFLKQEIISLYSAQGGAGRTTIALNLAWLLAESLKDLKILFLDLNFSEGYPDSAVRLSQEPLENSGILIDNITDLNSAFYRSITRIDGCGIDFIFPPPALNRSEGLSVDLLDEMVMRARKDYGIVIADIPNRFDNIFIEMLDLSTTILLVATPETSQVMRVNKLLKIMPADAAKMLVLNNRDNLKVSPGKVRMISSLSEMPFAGYMQYVMQAGRHGYLKIGRKYTEIISLRGQIEKLLDNLFADKHIM